MNNSQEFNLKVTMGFLLGMLTAFSEVFTLKALSQSTSSFLLCGVNCRQFKYYVGYNRNNIANLGKETSSLPIKPDTMFLNRPPA